MRRADRSPPFDMGFPVPVPPTHSLLRRGLFLRLVDVVADYAAEDSANCGADQASLHLDMARRRADDGAGGGPDCGVTLRMLHHDFAARRRCRRGDSAAVPAVGAAAA